MRQIDFKIAHAYAKHRIIKDSGRFTNNDWQQVARMVYKDDVKPLHYIRCRKTMNMPEVMKLAENRIMQLLDENGIGEDYAVKLLKDAEMIAKEKKEANNLIKIADIMLELRKQKPEKVRIQESRTFKGDNLSEVSNSIDKAIEEKRKITVSTTVSKPSENVENE